MRVTFKTDIANTRAREPGIETVMRRARRAARKSREGHKLEACLHSPTMKEHGLPRKYSPKEMKIIELDNRYNMITGAMTELSLALREDQFDSDMSLSRKDKRKLTKKRERMMERLEKERDKVENILNIEKSNIIAPVSFFRDLECDDEEVSFETTKEFTSKGHEEHYIDRQQKPRNWVYEVVPIFKAQM